MQQGLIPLVLSEDEYHTIAEALHLLEHFYSRAGRTSYEESLELQRIAAVSQRLWDAWQDDSE